MMEEIDDGACQMVDVAKCEAVTRFFPSGKLRPGSRSGFKGKENEEREAGSK
jgi:hypothetical protein